MTRNLLSPVTLKPSDSTSELIYETETLTDIEDKLMATKGERGDGDKLGVWD